MRVLEAITHLFASKYGCEEEEITMDATLDELNIAPHEREDMALVLGEMYAVEVDDTALRGFETVEDVVGYIEDALNAREEEQL